MDARATPTSTRTTCAYCGVGCGVVATPLSDGRVAIAGDAEHPANFGRLCSKGSALGETLGHEERLLFPEIGGRRAAWDEATALVAGRFSEAVAEHGPDSVAFYVSGQLLTEDYYVANKLMKGFIGSANIDTNSRLCMSSSVAGHVRAFGSDTVPGTYEDLEEADLLVLVGSNLAWCHPVLHQRILAAKALRPAMRIVAIDPRRTATAETADLHLPISADGDGALFSGLLAFLAENGAVDAAYVEAHTSGHVEALAAAAAFTPEMVAQETGLPQPLVLDFYRLFTATPKIVTIYSQGVNQSVHGTDKVNAIINCHLATGRIGRPGMGPFSVTGQPNAMGGREVGGLANILAAHMRLEEPAHRALVQGFWNAPRIPDRPGLKAVDLFRAVGEGRIKALWIMGTNPVDSMPDADAVRDALARCPFVVQSDISARTDTGALAHVRLPAAGWGEKDGTVTNSERRISRQRAFLPLPGAARPDWRIVCDVAAHMGFAEAFAFTGPAEIFAEHAALSGLANEGTRDFDISGLAMLPAGGYEGMAPVQWPVSASGTGGRFFAEGGFFHADRRARFVAPAARAAESVDPAFPLVLNTGRIRDQWHTMTRTGLSPRLSGHIAEPFLEIHPEDAEPLGICDADIVRLASPRGEALLRALVTHRQRRGSVFAPMHWTDQLAGRARIDAVVAPHVDPVSGQPGLKRSAVRVERAAMSWHGFAVLRDRPAVPAAVAYHALARTEGGWRLELAGAETVDALDLAATLFGPTGDGEMLAYRDERSGSHRFAAFRGGRLLGALWIAREPVGVSRLWAAGEIARDTHAGPERLQVLAGRGGIDRPDPGAIVCSCFQIGVNDIRRAVKDQGCLSVEAIGAALKAGTNCGSCRSEIKGIVDGSRVRESA